MINQNARLAQWGAWLNIGVYVLSVIIKGWIGFITQSQAIMADGLNNASDILLSIAILVGIKVALQPADQNHPYGHRKAETLATLFAAIFMFIVAIEIWISAIKSFFSEGTSISPLASLVALSSAIVMWLVSRINTKLSQKANSEALKAAAKDNQVDAWISFGAFVGTLGNYWGYYWMDPLVAFLVGIMIMRTVYEVGMPAIHQLMDGFDHQKLLEIEQQVKKVNGIDEVKEIRARLHGSDVYVELTVGVNAHLSVQESHLLTEEIEKHLLGFKNIVHVHVHVEPIGV